MTATIITTNIARAKPTFVRALFVVHLENQVKGLWKPINLFSNRTL